jgi:hypothetical protein
VENYFLFRDRRPQILALAARHAVPVIYGGRADAEAGGLMSYGPNAADTNRQFGIYTGRVLKGENPALRNSSLNLQLPPACAQRASWQGLPNCPGILRSHQRPAYANRLVTS